MKRKLLIACCWLGWSTSVSGAPITLDACLLRADQRSSSVKSFEMAAIAADESLTISRAAFYPTLKLKASYTLVDKSDRLIISGDSFAPGIPPQDVNLSTGGIDSYNIGLHLQQPLYTGGNLTQSRRRAEFQAEAARNDMTYQRSQVAQTVKKTFSETLAARLQAQALLKALVGTREQARVVQERLLEGHARREELLAAETEVSRTEADWARAENQAQLNLTTLRKLINATTDEIIEPTGTLSKTLLHAPLNELQTLSLQKRADLKSLQAKVGQSSADVGIARSGYLPQISLVGSYERQPETAITRADVWKIGAQAEWNLFEWGRTSAEVRRAAALERQEMFRLDDERKNVLLEVEQLWRDLKNAEKQLQATETQLKSREYTLEKVLDRYQEGLVKRVDLLLAESALWNDYAAYVQSATSLNTTLASLERALGAELSPWLEHTLLYEPAFEDIAKRIEQTAGSTSPLSGSVLAGSATVAEKMANVSHKSVEPSYLIQLGAFKSRENAVKALQSINKVNQNALHLTIVNEADIFKVIAGPFSQKDDAVHTAEGLGIKDFIVKVPHGP